MSSPVITVADERMEVSAVKRADDRSGDLIVRVFERTGQRAALHLDGIGAMDYVDVNLLEEPLPLRNGSTRGIDDTVHPYAVRTLRFHL